MNHMYVPYRGELYNVEYEGGLHDGKKGFSSVKIIKAVSLRTKEVSELGDNIYKALVINIVMELKRASRVFKV